MVILDSVIVIDLLRGKASAADLVKSYEGKERIAITAISRYELLRGARKSEEFKILGFLDSTIVYELGESEFDKAAELFKELSSYGSMINELDILIAAIALTNNETLISYDSDFKALRSSKILVIEK